MKKGKLESKRQTRKGKERGDINGESERESWEKREKDKIGA